MRRTVAILTAAILAGFAAAPSSSRTIPLVLHGTVILTGSSIRCGSGLLGKLTYIDCGISDASGQPKKGGFLVLMAADGRVNVLNTTTVKTVFSRMPAAAVKTPAGLAIHPGDVIQVPGTSISCNASSVSGNPTILCYYVDKKGVVRPGSTSFGISDAVATAVGWDAARHAKLLQSWPENG